MSGAARSNGKEFKEFNKRCEVRAGLLCWEEERKTRALVRGVVRGA